jgi:hypothetical protein
MRQKHIIELEHEDFQYLLEHCAEKLWISKSNKTYYLVIRGSELCPHCHQRTGYGVVGEYNKIVCPQCGFERTLIVLDDGNANVNLDHIKASSLLIFKDKGVRHE